MTTSMIILGLVLLAGINLVNQRIGLWLLLAIIPLYLVRLSVGPIPTTFFEISIYLTVLIFAIRNLKHLPGLIQKAWRPIWIPLVLWMIGFIIGVAISPDTMMSLGIFKAWFIDPLLIYFLIASAVASEDFAFYLSAPLLSTIPMSLVAIWQVIAQTFITVDGRASAWFVSANYLSMYLVPVLILGLIVFLSRNQWHKALAVTTWLLGLAALFFSFSYGGWLSLLVASAVLAIIYFRKYWKIWIWAGAIPILALLSQFGSDRFSHMIDLAQRSSASVRLQVWQTAWLMVKENWLTGIGPGQFRDQYLDFASRLFSPPWELAMLHSHSLLLQTVINVGILGVIGLIWLLVAFFRMLAPRINLVSTTLISAMVAIITHGLIDTTYWKNDLSAIFWIVIGLAVVFKYQTNSQHE